MAHSVALSKMSASSILSRSDWSTKATASSDISLKPRLLNTSCECDKMCVCVCVCVCVLGWLTSVFCSMNDKHSSWSVLCW